MTEEEGATSAAVPARTLTGDEEEAYVRDLQAILRTARLNSQYPDVRALASHLSALAPDVHKGLYAGVEADLRTGLPTYKEWTRVQTDVTIAPEQLEQLGPRPELEERVRQSPISGIHERQLRKHDYYSALSKVRLAPLGEMTVALRRCEPEQRRAHFHVTLDKLDASGLFVRTTIELAQTDDAWVESVVVLDDEAARHTEGLRSLVYKLTTYDAELTFVRLATIGNLTVERVTKGVVGPFCFPWVRVPEALRSVLSSGRFVAMFSLDMAAIDLAADRDNDPFEDLVVDRLSPEGRLGYDRARQRYGYHVFKDRKFVVSPELVAPLREICERQRTRNIVYPV